MQPITTQQLITERLNELSSDLHSQVSQMLNQLQAQQPQTIDEMVQKQLELMLPNLYQQLLTHLTEQVNQKTETHNQQITQYLDELDKLQKSEIATLKKRTRRISKIAGEDTASLEQIAEHTTRRRQRHRKVNQQLTGIGEDIAGLTETAAQRTARLRKFNRRAHLLKTGYDHDAQQFKTASNDFGTVVGTVSAVVKAVIELFKKLFDRLKQQVVGYAKEGVLYSMDSDGKQHKMNQRQAESYVSSHPYDLSGYAQLTLTAKKLEKDKELRHEPFRGFGI